MSEKAYGIDQVAHFFLSTPERPVSGRADSALERQGETTVSVPEGEGGRNMLRIASEIRKSRIARGDLMAAAGDFLIHYLGNPEVLRIKGVSSPDFGRPDLTFTNRGKDRVTVARLNTGEPVETFVIQSVAYSLWLQELLQAGGSILDVDVALDLFCISRDFPKALCRSVAAHRASGLPVHLIRYRLFQVEGEAEPVVQFEPIVTSPSLSPARRPAAPASKQTLDPVDSQDTAVPPASGDAEEHLRFMKLRGHLED